MGRHGLGLKTMLRVDVHVKALGPSTFFILDNTADIETPRPRRCQCFLGIEQDTWEQWVRSSGEHDSEDLRQTANCIQAAEKKNTKGALVTKLFSERCRVTMCVSSSWGGRRSLDSWYSLCWVAGTKMLADSQILEDSVEPAITAEERYWRQVFELRTSARTGSLKGEPFHRADTPAVTRMHRYPSIVTTQCSDAAIRCLLHGYNDIPLLRTTAH